MQTIMLIDDNEIDLFVNKKIIKSVYPDSKIVSFKKADDALEFLKLISISDEKKFPNIILLDLYMPNAANGFKFLREYHALSKEVSFAPQVIVLTCSINPFDRIESLLFTSVKEFVTKPLSTDKIYHALRN